MDPLIRVTIVDDHEIFRSGLKMVINKLGYAKVVAEAADGVEFLELLEQEETDIVLMDIEMPRMNGIEATKIIREIEKTRGLAQPVTIIAITANALGEERNSCIEVGIDGFLTKPFNLDKLPQVLSHIKETVRP